MQARILAVANQKGGVGKTTTAINLGSALARKGKKVLIVDLDPHACASLHTRILPETAEANLYDIFVADEKLWPQIWPRLIQRTAIENVSIAPACIKLSELENDFRDRKSKGSVLLNALQSLKSEYDYIILDCPPHLGILLINALVAADLLIIPIQTDFMALHGLKLLFDTLRTLNKALPKPVKYRALPTMFDKRAKACTRVLELLKQKMGNAMFETIVGIDTHFREASALGCSIFEVDARSRGSIAYSQLADEILALC
ncbi:MAG: ParA family protein [Desulfovibrio sp.]|nr:ParA family protein [Desulfovibrio sp.]